VLTLGCALGGLCKPPRADRILSRRGVALILSPNTPPLKAENFALRLPFGGAFNVDRFPSLPQPIQMADLFHVKQLRSLRLCRRQGRWSEHSQKLEPGARVGEGA
jgi:hypothetical protein